MNRLLTLLIGLFAVGVTAQTVAKNLPVITSAKDIRVKFQNCSSPDVANRLTELFQSTVWDGLKTIEKINPELAKQGFQKLKGREINSVCEFAPGFNGPWYNKNKEIMYLGVFTIASGDRKIWLQNTMFHETTHLLKWDNMDVNLHDDNAGAGLAGAAKDLDVVYACASFAFPDDRLGGVGVVLTEVERYNHLLIACRTCAQAKFNESQTRTIATFATRPAALEKCQKLLGPEPAKAVPTNEKAPPADFPQ